jgi:hypothetical protein
VFVKFKETRINMQKVTFYEPFTFEGEELTEYTIRLMKGPHHNRECIMTLEFDTRTERDTFLNEIDDRVCLS